MNRVRPSSLTMVLALSLAGLSCSGADQGSSGDKFRLIVTPASADVPPGMKQHFVATAAARSLAVNWSIVEPNGGTIAANGLYTAPGSPGTYTVVATNAADPRARGVGKVYVTSDPTRPGGGVGGRDGGGGEGGGDGAPGGQGGENHHGDGGTLERPGGAGGAGGVRGGTSISVTPMEVALLTHEHQRFVAEIVGVDSVEIDWSVQGGETSGTIDETGLYIAPASAGTYTVVATSRADSHLVGTASVIVREVVVDVEPASATIPTSGQIQFSATVLHSANGAVEWTVEEGEMGGTLDPSGLYIAPDLPGTYTVVATSLASSTSRGTAEVRVREVKVTIEPPVVEITTSGHQQFEARVAGISNTAVTWTIQGENGGTIDAEGNYQAPSTPGSFEVIATSVADPTKSASAEVTIVRPSSTDPTGLLPPDRLTRWVPGLNSVGGIPLDNDSQRPATVYLPPGNPYRGYSVDPGIANGSTDATAAIQAALNAAGAQARETSRRIVYLAEGEYALRNNGLNIPSFVTLRGRGPRGESATRLVKPSGTNLSVINLGHLWVKTTTPVDLAEDAPHGATRVTVKRNPGYQVGELVFVDQLVDENRVGSWWNPLRQQDPNGYSRGWFSRQNRPTGQVLEVKETDKTTITFTTPLRLPYFTTNEAQIVRFSEGVDGPMVPTKKWSGVEDLLLSGGEGGDGGGNIHFFATSYSWVQNVESVNSGGTSVAFESTFRCVLRDSFVHSTSNPNPGGGGYGIGFLNYASDNLIENNISWNFNKVIIMRASGGGNVIGYNYFEDGWGAGYPTIPEVGLNASHYATPHHELFEGNQSWNISGDAFWGNSIYNTFFRNHVTGRRRSIPPLNLSDQVTRRFVEVPEWHLFFSYLGNVIGTADMIAAPQSGFIYEGRPPWNWNPVPVWAIGVEHNAGRSGQDARVVATTVRHGNFDYVRKEIVWDPGIERRDLPPSLYLEAKPSFFGSRQWPWVSPENDETPVGILPARDRFDQLMGN